MRRLSLLYTGSVTCQTIIKDIQISPLCSISKFIHKNMVFFRNQYVRPIQHKLFNKPDHGQTYDFPETAILQRPGRDRFPGRDIRSHYSGPGHRNPSLKTRHKQRRGRRRSTTVFRTSEGDAVTDCKSIN